MKAVSRKSSGGRAAAKSRTSPTFAGMAAAVADAKQAALSKASGPAEPDNYAELVAHLVAAQGKFPPVYEQSFAAPFLATIQGLGAAKFARILSSDPQREGQAGLLFDLAQAILQHAEGYHKNATRAFQEFISDLYDGFLSAEDRHGIKPPDLGVIPPLAKWGNPDSGPYTWPIDAAASFGVKAGVVNLPPANASAGLVAWAALGHETAGHDVLHADSGLQAELAKALRDSLAPLGQGLASYWADRIDETSSDVMGVLNVGPAAGIGLIAYFRGLNAAWGDGPLLRSDGPRDDPHPADIVRGYVAAEVAALLAFSESAAWSKAIAAETDKDRRTIVLDGRTIPPALARRSAKIVAKVLVQGPAKALESHVLGDIQNWHNSDESLVQALRAALRAGSPLPATDANQPIYAAHLVAAATIEAIATGGDPGALQARMITELDALHDRNPSWGPLYVAHPGNLHRDLAYQQRGRRRHG